MKLISCAKIILRVQFLANVSPLPGARFIDKRIMDGAWGNRRAAACLSFYESKIKIIFNIEINVLHFNGYTHIIACSEGNGRLGAHALVGGNIKGAVPGANIL